MISDFDMDMAKFLVQTRYWFIDWDRTWHLCDFMDEVRRRWPIVLAFHRLVSSFLRTGHSILSWNIG